MPGSLFTYFHLYFWEGLRRPKNYDNTVTGNYKKTVWRMLRSRDFEISVPKVVQNVNTFENLISKVKIMLTKMPTTMLEHIPF